MGNKGGHAVKPAISGVPASGVVALCAAVIAAVCLLGAADAQAKGGSPSWHGLTYHGAMLGSRGAYACDASGRAHLVRPRICRTGH
jgi:hypothetical protein